MIHRIKAITLGALLLATASIAPATAQTDSVPKVRPVTRATLYGIGTANVLDTYLSPQAYRGVEVRILRESTRQTTWMDGRLYRQSLFQTHANYTHNHVDNNNTLAALANWNWGLHYHIPLTHNFSLGAGGMADLNGGFVYNLRNGNNPAQARAYVNLDASLQALWDVRIRRYPIHLRYQLSVPLMGVMFMPEYGASYYEIFSWAMPAAWSTSPRSTTTPRSAKLSAPTCPPGG